MIEDAGGRVSGCSGGSGGPGWGMGSGWRPAAQRTTLPSPRRHRSSQRLGNPTPFFLPRLCRSCCASLTTSATSCTPSCAAASSRTPSTRPWARVSSFLPVRVDLKELVFSGRGRAAALCLGGVPGERVRLVPRRHSWMWLAHPACFAPRMPTTRLARPAPPPASPRHRHLWL